MGYTEYNDTFSHGVDENRIVIGPIFEFVEQLSWSHGFGLTQLELKDINETSAYGELSESSYLACLEGTVSLCIVHIRSLISFMNTYIYKIYIYTLYLFDHNAALNLNFIDII